MGIAFRHDGATNIATWVWDGAVGAEEWAAAVREQLAQPSWPPRGNITDLTTADVSAISDDDITAVAGLYREEAHRIVGVQSAIVADRAFRQARTFESVVAPHGQRVIVFTDVSAACAWLGIDVSATLTTIRQLRNELRAAHISELGVD